MTDAFARAGAIAAKHFYLKHAWDAVRHSHAIELCGTHWDDAFRTLGGAKRRVEFQRELLADRLNREPDVYKQIAITAQTAEAWKSGNCHEFACVCFHFLKHRGIGPLDFVEITSPTGHAFVVVGRLENSNPYDFSTWGPSAVVCDGWAANAYDLERLPVEWPGPNPVCKVRWSPNRS
jgi:hypothetical protein